MESDTLYLISILLNNRKERVKINSYFSSVRNIIGEVPQGSLLGPLLFDIFLADIFLVCPTEIVNYADNNTPYATGDCLQKGLKKKKPQTLCLNGSLIIIWSQM